MSFKRNELLIVFLLGGFVYMGLEVIWRGYSHWSMGICGGLSFLFIYLFEITKATAPLYAKCLFGTLVITSLELITGFFVNFLLGWNVWDYSDRFLNLFGQICPLFSIVWFFISIPAFFIAKTIKNKFFVSVTQEKT